MVFEFDGEKYKQASKHQKIMGMQLISELSLKGHEIILDLGCGDGVLTEKLARLVPNGRVIGIDASQGMIQTAGKLLRDNLEFLQMDIDNMSLETKFDIVFSNATLHWVKDHKKLLENMYQCLKPKGIMRYNFAGDGNCANLCAVLNEVKAERYFAAYFYNFEWPWYMPKVDEYEILLNQSEFSSKKVWGEITDDYFASVEEMIEWIDQPCLVPFLIHIEEKDKKNFRNMVIERMIERTRQADGRCFETGRRINVLAKK